MNKEKLLYDGFVLEKKILSAEQISGIQNELLLVGNLLDPSHKFVTLDDLWNHHRSVDRECAGSIYNAFKHLRTIKKLATSDSLENFLRAACGFTMPALIDIKCRIDSAGEDKYLFDWHQDYWFSVCSPKAVVVWIPITGLDPGKGGLQIIGNSASKGKIFNTKKNTGPYNSYADAVLLDEEVDQYPSIKIDEMEIGDILCFHFNVLHRSLPVISATESRFTVQLRFADFNDINFIENKFKPGTVNSTKVDYLQKEST